jgi:hypothetical protein
MQRLAIAVAIAGHHGGLPDASYLPALADESAPLREALIDLPDEITALPVMRQRRFANATHLFMFTQMIASAHIDADWQNAAEWEREVCGAPITRPSYPSIEQLYRQLESVCSDTRLDRSDLRTAFRLHYLSAAERVPGFYSFSAPLGAFNVEALALYGLAHARRNARERVILVCSTQMMFEECTDKLRASLGDAFAEPAAFDVQSCGFSPRVETWDAPVVVTALRDFLGLLFDNRPASLRRFHHLARAVVVVVDAQQIPLPVRTLTREALQVLVDHFHASVSLVSAVPYGVAEDDRPELLGPKDAFNTVYGEIQTTWPDHHEPLPSAVQIAHEIAEHAECLTVLQDASRLREVAQAMRAYVPDVQVTAVSSRMCAEHRRAVIRNLRGGCIIADEIGSALARTFNTVLCEMTELPTMAAAACRAFGDGQRRANFKVLLSTRRTAGAVVTHLMWRGRSTLAFQDPATWREYFLDLRSGVLPNDRQWADARQADVECLRFRTLAAEMLRVGKRCAAPVSLGLGEASLVPVVVPMPLPRGGSRPATKALIDRLRADGSSQEILRRLMSYVVWISVDERTQLLRDGHAVWVSEAVVYVINELLYDEFGLKPLA